MATHSSILAWKIPRTEEPGRLYSKVSQSQTWLSEFTFTFYGEQYGDSLKNQEFLKKLLYNPATPLLGIYPEETIIEKDTCTPMFIAALFTIARTWKQLRCPLTDEWIKKLWYKYTMEYQSAIKRNTFDLVLMEWMNLQPIIQRKVSQEEKDKYHLLTHIWNLERQY